MSEFREELLVTAINKKRIIKIILTAVLLVFAFAFSTFFFSLLWDSQRPLPSDELAEAEQEDGIPTQIPFPYNMSDFQDMFSDLSLTPDQLSDLLDALEDMFDGDIDDLDLGDYGQALAALMFSEVEVFRIFDYDDYNEILTKFWKYESFDEYTGDGWHSSAATAPSSYYTYVDYLSKHWDKDLLTLQIPLTPSIGINSMVIPNLFPTPFIMENSVQANNMQGTPALYKDEFNCTTLDIDFSMEEDVNMTYEMFGLDLPTSSEIDAMAIEPSYTPIPIQSKYLQLKGDTINVYISNNNDFAYHYNQINATILSSDNTFIVADKIRNYLQYNFIRISDPSQYNPAPDGYDEVEWFLEEGMGYWSDFTSAFCAFSRAFGVASRFVDGFNTFLAEELIDNSTGQNTIVIKYKNMYNWAEIYIPTDVSGDGLWIQMDVYYDNYGSVPPSLANYNLILNSNFTEGYRGATANLTALLTLDGAPVEDAMISFYDLTSLQPIGQSNTNLDGNASIIVNIDDLQVVGPHVIFAQYNPDVNGNTTYTVYGDIQVNLQNVNPQEVNISIDTSTNIQGFVIDPVNNQRVSGVEVDFILLQKGTNVKVGDPPFDIISTATDLNGDFNIDTNVYNVSVGQYDLRVDTNGSWYVMSGFVNASGFVNDSSNRMDFNVTKGIVKKVWFYINDIPSDNLNSPVVNRYTNLILKAKVVNETNYPLPNQNVQFFDFWNGIQIGANTTDSNGVATYNYSVNNLMIPGPNLLYAKIGIEENHSFFILNEEPIINILSGPTPREVNRTAIGASNIYFSIEGELLDNTTGNPIRNSNVSLRLLRGGIDYSSFLIPSTGTWTDFNGYVNISYRVASNTPTGNYTLRLDFNGTIYRMGYLFDLPYINTSSAFMNELRVTTPTTLAFNFWIDGTPSDDHYQPIINRNGDVNLSVYLEWGEPLDNEFIDFYDLTQNIPLGTVQTNNGRASLIYNTNASTVAGPHLIYVKWGSNYNYSYFTLNDKITLDVQVGPSPNQINRGGETFTLQGTITDASNGAPIKFTEIYITLFDDSMTDVSYYLSSNFFQLDDTGTFDLTLSVDIGTPAINYTINVGFNGAFIYSFSSNPHNFYFDTVTYSNFTSNDDGNFELKVFDPDDVAIQFWVDGNPALSFYDNFNLPERYNQGDFITFSVYVTQSETPVSNRTVTLTDVYINSQIGSHLFDPADNGRWDFIINSSSWHAGLHKIRVQWSIFPAINTTFVVINESVSISAFSSVPKIQRDVDSFNIYGSVQDGTTNLNGLDIRILLFDSSMNDVSHYLAGSQLINVFGGSYQFDMNSISINCPQGQYYFRIDFNGTISQPGIDVTNYMINKSSILVPVNVTAGTYIVGNYDTTFKDGFYEGDTLYAYGNLYWDNGSLITGSKTITITIDDGFGGVIKTEVGTTDGSGWFNITVAIDSPDWPDGAEIWASFYPVDSFIEFTEIELFRS